MTKQLIRSTKIEKEIMLRVGLRMIDSHEVEKVDVLLDSGATGLFIDHAWLHQNKITTHKLEHPIEVYNIINGSINRGGSIMEEVTLILSYQGHKECTVFKVCDLGKSNLIIGYTWLHKHNPEINWETGKVEMSRCPQECNISERRQKGSKKRKRGVRGLIKTPLFIHVYTRGCCIYSQLAISKTPSLTYYLQYTRIL